MQIWESKDCDILIKEYGQCIIIGETQNPSGDLSSAEPAALNSESANTTPMFLACTFCL